MSNNNIDKDKEKKLNRLLLDNNGKLNSSIMSKKLKVKGGSLIKSSNAPRDEKQLTDPPKFFKLDTNMKHEKAEFSAQQHPVYKEVKPKHKYSTEPIVSINHQKASDIYTDASKQATDGLTAADLGIPSTLNKQLTMMSIKYVKPSVYGKMSYTDQTVPPGYMGALMMNIAKQRQMGEQSQYAQQLSSLEQTSSADELKKRRNQLTLDYNYFLKKTGNDKLKESLGELAFDFTDEMFPDISRDVLSNLPSRVDTMPNDMDSMEALISELNNTSKNILIMDEIYINSMITMQLNDYFKKDTRDTTFIFRPFNEIKNFTDSEGLFTTQNSRKISTMDEYSYAGTDLVYLDLSLMKDVLYYVLCNVMIRITEDRHETSRNRTHIVIKTNSNLGSNETEFYKTMGFNVFQDIMETTGITAGPIEYRMIFDAVTGIRKFQSGVSTRIPLPKDDTATEASEREESNRQAIESAIEKAVVNLENIDNRIKTLDRAAKRTAEEGGNPRELVEEADNLYSQRKAFVRDINKDLVKLGQSTIDEEFKRDTEDIPKILEEKNKDRMDEERQTQADLEKELEKERQKREQGSLDDQTKLKTKMETVFYDGLDELRKHVLDTIDDYKKSPEYIKARSIGLNLVSQLKNLFNRDNKTLSAYRYTLSIDENTKLFRIKIRKLIGADLDITQDNISKFYGNIYDLMLDMFHKINQIDKHSVIISMLDDFIAETKKLLQKSTTDIDKFIKDRSDEIFKEEEDAQKAKEEELKINKIKQYYEGTISELRSKLLEKIRNKRRDTRDVGHINYDKLKDALLEFFTRKDIYAHDYDYRLEHSFKLDKKTGKPLTDTNLLPIIDKVEVEVTNISADKNRENVHDRLLGVLKEFHDFMRNELRYKPKKIYDLIIDLEETVKSYGTLYKDIKSRAPHIAGYGLSKFRKVHGGAGEGADPAAADDSEEEGDPDINQGEQALGPGGEPLVPTTLPGGFTFNATPPARQGVARTTGIAPGATNPIQQIVVNQQSDLGLKHNETVDKYIEQLHSYMYIKQLTRFNKSTFVMVV